jgi:alpha-maltose-1-phosphate synthase
VPFHHVDGADADIGSIWSAADMFCSLADNLQESFGLAVVEAMAAELPVVASNWNGYRDTVEHGVTGVLVDSYMPAGSLADIGYRYITGEDTYDRFVGGLSQLCVVDVVQTARWISRLGADPGLRRKLGAAAKRSVDEQFDWKIVLARYRELWREQRDRLDRARGGPMTRSTTWRRYDAAVTFAGYSSHRLDPTTLIARGPYFESWNDLARIPGVVVNHKVLIRKAEFAALRVAFDGGRPRPLEAVVEAFAPETRAAVLRSIHWLIKIGLLRIVPENS